jgi:hypothetical protein
MAPAQRTAWDTYLTVTRGLLPALYDDHVDAAGLNSQLGGVAVAILRYAPLWGEHGPMLVSALQSAVRLHRAGNRPDLADLIRAIADRLYVLSAGPALSRCDGDDRGTRPDRRNPWRGPTAPPHGTSAPERDQP